QHGLLYRGRLKPKLVEKLIVSNGGARKMQLIAISKIIKHCYAYRYMDTYGTLGIKKQGKRTIISDNGETEWTKADSSFIIDYKVYCD
ncbi:MAG TPA: hypothetical protein PKX38_08385, partial [Alphaproteobacteria bacterium]|nr:hypothetical protein [Alphaproteobacteria bacterium]